MQQAEAEIRSMATMEKEVMHRGEQLVAAASSGGKGGSGCGFGLGF